MKRLHRRGGAQSKLLRISHPILLLPRGYYEQDVEQVETVIIGGGHAGLTMSYYLSQLGREH
jgi:ribulose 1,5-bisphosphate synthetase/thiazole synthase